MLLSIFKKRFEDINTMSKINEIEKLGLTNIGKIHYNLSYDELLKHEVQTMKVILQAMAHLV